MGGVEVVDTNTTSTLFFNNTDGEPKYRVHGPEENGHQTRTLTKSPISEVVANDDRGN